MASQVSYSTNPRSYAQLLAAGVSPRQIREAINSGLNPSQLPPEYFGLTSGPQPQSVGQGAPVYQGGLGGIDIPPANLSDPYASSPFQGASASGSAPSNIQPNVGGYDIANFGSGEYGFYTALPSSSGIGGSPIVQIPTDPFSGSNASGNTGSPSYFPTTNYVPFTDFSDAWQGQGAFAGAQASGDPYQPSAGTISDNPFNDPFSGAEASGAPYQSSSGEITDNPFSDPNWLPQESVTTDGMQLGSSGTQNSAPMGGIQGGSGLMSPPPFPTYGSLNLTNPAIAAYFGSGSTQGYQGGSSGYGGFGQTAGPLFSSLGGEYMASGAPSPSVDWTNVETYPGRMNANVLGRLVPENQGTRWENTVLSRFGGDEEAARSTYFDPQSTLTGIPFGQSSWKAPTGYGGWSQPRASSKPKSR